MAHSGNICLVCEGENLRFLSFMFSEILPKIYHRVVICRDCFHVQIDPIYSEEEYADINQKWFERVHDRKEDESYKDDVARKIKQLDARLTVYIKEGRRILDVGAGDGFLLDYFMRRQCKYYFIESVEESSIKIIERGGVKVGSSIFDNYHHYTGQFDLIIFRHTLEHMLNPAYALIQLKEMLADTGIIYVALPNILSPGTRKRGYMTSFLRPVHVSYFTLNNVLELANKLELKAIDTESSFEIYCLLTHGKCDNPIEKHSLKEIILHVKKQRAKSLLGDTIALGKIVVKKAIGVSGVRLY